jgi:hypothetical protein
MLCRKGDRRQQKEEEDSWRNKILTEIIHVIYEYLRSLKLILGITECQYIS